MGLEISNRDARRFWLRSNGLASAPTEARAVGEIVSDLGFVQLDTIRNVVRAHDHIVWSRKQNYQEGQLLDLLKTREVFEHFTHDASVLPMATYPLWQRQFARRGVRVAKYYKTSMKASGIKDLLGRIEAEGPLSTHAFDTKAKSKKMWSRPPHKMELDKLWNAGRLATSHRDGFIKFYDLAERVFPAEIQTPEISDSGQIDWLCREALRRLGFATPSEISRFWGAVSIAEARAWAKETDVLDVSVQSANKSWVDCISLPEIREVLETTPSPTSRLRIINPFDPATRDRDRLLHLFGFEYRIEIFVPAAKRKWGYYVYPILEGDRFVGRIDLKGNRKSGVLNVVNLWAEGRATWTNARMRKLEKELARLARFAGLNIVQWECAPPNI